MNHPRAALCCILLVCCATSIAWGADTKPAGKPLELELQRRDAATGEVKTERETIAASECAIVVVDMWQYHWCATWCGRAAAMIPRINRTLESARKLGMTVVFAPTECAHVFAATPQRERMAALPHHPLPQPGAADLPEFPIGGGEMCGGPYPCIPNFGHYGQDSRLVVADTDLISSGAQEMYNLCKERGIKRLVYTGGAANACLVYKPEAMLGMTRYGMKCAIARDLNEAMTAHSGSDSADKNTAAITAHIEKYLAPSVNLQDLLQKAGAWNDQWIVDPVLIAPWGFKERPKFFETAISVSMSIPRIRVPGAEIRYTVDGTEPTTGSTLYKEPFELRDSAVLKAAAFKDGARVSLTGESCYFRLPPPPPMPDVHISDLSPLTADMFAWNPHDRPNPGMAPGRDRNYTGGGLSVRGAGYGKGLGLYAPAEMTYELKPEYTRFVARAGIDDGCMFSFGGRGRAGYPTVVFKVFVDGKLAAESPVLTICQEPWRFNVEIPAGSRVISLAATDAGDGNREDLADWVNAGFVTAKASQ